MAQRDLNPFARRNSRVIATRLTRVQFACVTSAARAAGRSVGEHVRVALTGVKLAAGGGNADYQKEWEAMAKLLGIDPTDVGAMLAMIDQIVEAVTAPPATEPTDSAPDPAALGRAPAAPVATLSERAACRKAGVDVATYLERKASLLRRS